MSKIALLADIHSNSDALSAVLDAAAAEGVEQLLIAGDFTGYYYAAERMLDLLSTWAWSGIRGNHEDLLREWCGGSRREWLRGRYGSGYEQAAEQLSPKAIETLVSLPEQRSLTLAGRAVLLCHGSPWDHEAYIYPDADGAIRGRLDIAGTDLVLFGHSHYPVTWAAKYTTAVNPGSVGQPRDRKGGACWALWDTQTNRVEQRREFYDVGALVEECRRRDPHLPYLAEVLQRR